MRKSGSSPSASTGVSTTMYAALASCTPTSPSEMAASSQHPPPRQNRWRARRPCTRFPLLVHARAQVWPLRTSRAPRLLCACYSGPSFPQRPLQGGTEAEMVGTSHAPLDCSKMVGSRNERCLMNCQNGRNGQGGMAPFGCADKPAENTVD
jgi:hypothetical protein